ncbi:MAG: hypothetical protein NXI23_10710 [Bacteroidetes bacterium]|jgi:hypothetical protein|nr:hypothetical protein [Bacteroidota bacterium]
MNKLLLLFIFLCSNTFIIAQVPALFSYQALATDLNGDELPNQNISIEATIISGDILIGTEEWVERHALTTDEFGLFSIEIGNGLFISGTVTNFSEINWASGDHFLKIGMDPIGGTNFDEVGTNQLLSVPYALQAANSINADSADSADYALSALQATYADTALFALSTLNTVLADTASISLFAIESDTSDFSQTALHALTADTAFYAFNAGNSTYSDTSNFALYELNDFDRDSTNEIQNLSISGDTLSINGGNSVVLTSESTFSNPGATLQFPQGVEDAEYLFVADTYTVPTGKIFYIVAAEDEVRLPGIGADQGEHKTSPSMPMFVAGQEIDNCRCTGFLKDIPTNIEPVIFVLFPGQANFYAVPTGKILILKSGLTNNTPISLNNQIANFFSTTVQNLVIPSELEIRKTGNDEIIITGYLKDAN